MLLMTPVPSASLHIIDRFRHPLFLKTGSNESIYNIYLK
jgi:hypothetical protein